ncbi:MAG TPA: phenylalanine--tRNA ligase subunit beta [Oleiagrimonas sp.]|nr:phenylalanine--tRNA ligase subunit beta [Oleiagrimonas sp.]
MKFSENWLRDLVAIDIDRDALAERLTMAGLEVEEVQVLGASLDGIVVGEIIAAEKHPEADRLQLCQVAAGSDEPLQIVCGAPNARVGLKAPLATLGATMPGGMKIKKAKLRGIESFGMLCSARELGVDADASGLMELAADAPVGTPLADYLGLPDASIDVGLTPNRPDCLGMLGLARDVAAILDAGLAPRPQVQVSEDSDARRDIQLEAGSDCPRYLGRVVEGIDATASTPLWMTERLRRAGVRPISVVVDITNYVMLELGQPMHAFDNDKLDGDIVVRPAASAETVTLLDDSAVTLDEGFMVIADASQALAVAGVMGGKASRVTDATRNVFLESAHFAPPAIMGRARKLGLHTDASHRFERGVDPELPRVALERASELLLTIAGGKAGPVCVAENTDALPANAPVRLRRARLHRVLGLSIDDTEVARILAALDMQVETTDDGWQATAPSRRFDIEREEDLIEEVARVHGYQRIPVRAPSGELVLGAQPEAHRPARDIALDLVDRDCREAINLAFIGADVLETWGMGGQGVPLANPLTTDMAVMRPSLLPGLVEAMRHNLARQQTRVRLFERGHVFAAPVAEGEAPIETDHVAWIACGPAAAEQWGVPTRAVDFHDIKGDLDALIAATATPEAWAVSADELPSWLHPGRSARVLRDGIAVGVIGQLHPRLLAALDLDRDVYVVECTLDALSRGRLPRAQAVTRFPSVRRDIAMDLPEGVPWADVSASIRRALGVRLHGLHLFDSYQGKGVDEGRKSLAIGLILLDESRTLKDDDAHRCVADAVAALENDCQARLRG